MMKAKKHRTAQAGLVERRVIPTTARMKIKQPCPICGGQLYVSCIDEWTQEESGDWIATSLNIECSTEPDLDSDEWTTWMNEHYKRPYMDWLPIEKKLLPEFQRKFRFDV
jgi:hypothetical protein